MGYYKQLAIELDDLAREIGVRKVNKITAQYCALRQRYCLSTTVNIVKRQLTRTNLRRENRV